LEELFEFAMNNQKLPRDRALPMYNLGVLLTKQGKYSEARRQFETARDVLKNDNGPEFALECLVIPKVNAIQEELQFEEVWNPMLSHTIELALSAVDQIGE
jgi:hypothetical protein